MTPIQIATAVKARSLERLPWLAYYDGEVPATPPGPYVVLTYALDAPTARRIDGSHSGRHPCQLMVVNDSIEGVRIAAARVADEFDGWRPAPGLLCRYEGASAPIKDEDVIGDYRYSLTLDLTIHTPKQRSSRV